MNAAITAPRPFLWVAFPDVAGGWTKIIARAIALGFGGIAPRAGEGLANGTFAPSLNPKIVTKIRDAGLECQPWIFSRPAAIAAETSAFRQLEDAGATALIIDAEAPWDADPNARARALVYGELMTREISVPIFDAPWPAVAWHPSYPEAEFRQWVTGRYPQCYWSEIGWSARKTLDVMRAQWAGRDDRLMPIGITYGRKELARLGVKQLPPGEISITDVRAVAAEITGGWYTLEAAGVGVLEAIAEEMRSTIETEPTLPDGAATPLGWADRAEQAAEQATVQGTAVDDQCAAFYCRNRDMHDGYAEKG